MTEPIGGWQRRTRPEEPEALAGRRAYTDPHHGSPPAGPSRTWLPIVLLGTLSALSVFLVLTLAGTWLRGSGTRLPSVPLTARAPSVDLWVGELSDGVKAVLSAVFNEPQPDLDHDRVLNSRLLPDEDPGLAYYRILVFNTSDRAVTVRLGDGEISITPKGGEPLPMRNLAPLVVKCPAAFSSVLSALGATRETLEVPPGRGTACLVGFSRRVPLAEAAAVATRDGTAFHRSRIPLQRWIALTQAPTLDEVKDL